jgi:hypothetical protein
MNEDAPGDWVGGGGLDARVGTKRSTHSSAFVRPVEQGTNIPPNAAADRGSDADKH